MHGSMNIQDRATIYKKKLPVAHGTHRRMAGWFVNNKWGRMQEETVVVYGEIHRSTFVMWSQNIHYARSGDRTVVVFCVGKVPQTVLQTFPFHHEGLTRQHWHHQCRVCECVVNRSDLSHMFMISGKFYNLTLWPGLHVRGRKCGRCSGTATLNLKRVLV
jgi:hypothetical protein